MEIQEVVEDAFDDEMLPPTQLPVPIPASKTKKTRASNRRPAASAAPTDSSSGGASTSRSKAGSGVSAATKRAVGQTVKTPANMTQKRKDNISASFMTSLSSKGISDVLMKTKR